MEWLEDQAEAVTGGITTDLEYLPIGGLKEKIYDGIGFGIKGKKNGKNEKTDIIMKY